MQSIRNAGYLYRVANVKSADPSAIRQLIESELATFLSAQKNYLESIGSELIPAADALTSFLLDGGKRLRPLFAYFGFIGAGGDHSHEVIKACSSLELLQACALIHDDLMDGSDTRRGKAAIHKHFEKLHTQESAVGSSAAFGQAAAILLGDLALVYSDLALHQSGIESDVLPNVLAVHDEMRVELMAGQFLDVYEQTRSSHTVERALTIARYKSGKYTIERPLHFGAALATTDKKLLAEVTSHYSAYGLPLGEAFQLRDDLLGVFGDPELTGKPAGDDLREGKRTVLIAMAQESMSAKEIKEFESLFGQADLNLAGVEKLRTIITDTGAPTHVENLITELTNKAINALDTRSIADTSRQVLNDLAIIATKRNL
jgi:geranylgeranyl diphosphate synthase type I